MKISIKEPKFIIPSTGKKDPNPLKLKTSARYRFLGDGLAFRGCDSFKVFRYNFFAHSGITRVSQ